MQPRITIITPTHNHSRHLERTICSVLDQGYAELEYIVIDGGSDDRTLSILKLYEEEISCWLSKASAAPKAIETALRHATGELVMILPGDGLLLPGALYAIARHWQATKAPWLAAPALRLSREDYVLGKLEAGTLTMPEALVQATDHLATAAQVYARNLFEKFGPLDEECPTSYELEFACRLMTRGLEPSLLRQVVLARREDESPAAERVEQWTREYLALADRYAETLPMRRRLELWRQCDRRQRHSASLVATEDALGTTRLIGQVLRRPWWLADDEIRQLLTRRPRTARKSRRAA